MKIEYTELEREKKLRIETQLELLQEQANRLVGERAALFNSILDRGKVPPEKRAGAIFNAIEAVIEEGPTQEH